MDINGQMIKSIINKYNSNTRSSIYFEIDFSQFKNGNYLLIVETFNKTNFFKITYVQ